MTSVSQLKPLSLCERQNFRPDWHDVRSHVQAAQRKHEELRSKYLRQSAQLAGRAPEGTALQRIAAAVPEGPLSLLRRAVQTQRPLRVVTRHARGVRGVATGDAGLWRLSHSVQCAGVPTAQVVEEALDQTDMQCSCSGPAHRHQALLSCAPQPRACATQL